MFKNKTLPKHLDKTEHYDAMHAALTKLAGGEYPDEVEVIAIKALCADTRNEADFTFNEFLSRIEAADWPVDDEDVWLGYWSDGFTPEEAVREEAEAGDHEAAES